VREANVAGRKPREAAMLKGEAEDAPGFSAPFGWVAEFPCCWTMSLDEIDVQRAAPAALPSSGAVLEFPEEFVDLVLQAERAAHVRASNRSEAIRHDLPVALTLPQLFERGLGNVADMEFLVPGIEQHAAGATRPDPESCMMKGGPKQRCKSVYRH